MIGIAEKQGRKTLELRDAELVWVGEVYSGTSQRTGQPWKVRSANLRFSVGTNANGQTECMMMTVRCLNEVCDKIGMVATGTHLHAFVRLDLDLHFKAARTECSLIDFTL